MVNRRRQISSAGVTTDDYDAPNVECEAFTADPTTLNAGPRIMQYWG